VRSIDTLVVSGGQAGLASSFHLARRGTLAGELAGTGGGVRFDPQPGGRDLALVAAFNEAARIRDVVREASAHLPVLVVDDGSSDATASEAEAAGASVLIQRPNQGKGAALRAGFRWALERGFDAVVTLDGDGQHDPATIPAFLAARAVAGDPSLLLCDDPTASLDEALATQVIGLLVSLHREGRTVLIVTRDQLAAAYSSRTLTVGEVSPAVRQEADR